MTTIILTVSRSDFLEQVLDSLAMQDASLIDVSIICMVDGDSELYVKTRNMIDKLPFGNRLTVQFRTKVPAPSRYDVLGRRKRIAAIHNQIKEYIAHDNGWVFVLEDDTIIPYNALRKLTRVMLSSAAIAQVTGVELGRWGVPYVGAWRADDIYDMKQLVSVPNNVTNPEAIEDIDACGLYCTMIRTDLYKQHDFTSENGLGPDINLGIENRQLGYLNKIHWGVPCSHYTINNGVEIHISPFGDSKQVTLTKMKNKWHTSH